MSNPAAPDLGGLGFLAHSPTAADRSLARELGLPITGDRGSGFTLLLTREGEVLQLLWGNRSGPGPVAVGVLVLSAKGFFEIFKRCGRNRARL